MAKADVHVHSKHSNEPSEWYLRKLGAPESFTEPKEIYRRCRERGMDFVTISDHDSIAGALEIAHLPGTFLSCEVTVEFPEDRCEIHVLTLGISEAQHREIQALRGNVYELRDYLRANGILCSVAHPLFRVNDRLTLDHVEKLLVLFDRFEALNGMHDRRANGLVRRIFGSLTPDRIETLAERHGLAPWGPTPWIKTFTGGSDDHGGLYLGATWTETPPAMTVEDYLVHLRNGRHEAGGDTGSSARLVQSLYAIAYEFYRRQFPLGIGRPRDPFSELLRSLALGAPARPSRWVFWRRPAASQPELMERSTFGSASRASQKYLGSLLRGLVRHARRGRLMEGLASISHLAPLALSVAPYLVAAHSLHKDADLLDEASLRFLGERPEEGSNGRRDRRAWLTDSLADAEGVAQALRTLPGPDRELVALTCAAEEAPAGLEVRSFRPLMCIRLPGWERRKLAVPPLLEVLDHCERERYAEIVISSPGPFGLLGVAAGRLLGIPVTGLYCTELPSQVRQLAGSEALEALSWSYLRWLFGHAERLWVPSTREWELLAGHGFSPARLALLTGGRRMAA